MRQRQLKTQMVLSPVVYSKGQIKIQQMAFVLVAFAIFFAIVIVFYLSIKLRSVGEDAIDIRFDKAREEAKKISGLPELAWTIDDCSSCIDLDKAMALKNRVSYNNLWSGYYSIMQIQRIYPSQPNVECTIQNYPACSKITLVNKNNSFMTVDSFVALCMYDSSIERPICGLGKIIIGVSRE